MYRVLREPDNNVFLIPISGHVRTNDLMYHRSPGGEAEDHLMMIIMITVIETKIF